MTVTMTNVSLFSLMWRWWSSPCQPLRVTFLSFLLCVLACMLCSCVILRFAHPSSFSSCTETDTPLSSPFTLKAHAKPHVPTSAHVPSASSSSASLLSFPTRAKLFSAQGLSSTTLSSIEKLQLEFHSISVSARTSRWSPLTPLISDTWGCVRSGQVVALMGQSGAGKPFSFLFVVSFCSFHFAVSSVLFSSGRGFCTFLLLLTFDPSSLLFPFNS